MTFNEFVGEQRRIAGAKKIPAEINQRWHSRVIVEGHHERGEAGVATYLAHYGKNIAAPKLVLLARKAEVEGFHDLARGFWKAAYRVATGKEPEGSLSAVPAVSPMHASPIAMAEQPLGDVAGLPDHLQPGKIVTMQPVDANEDRAFYISSEKYWGQPKRNGHRKVAIATPVAVYYQSRQLNVDRSFSDEIDRAFVFVASGLGPFVVDGEAYYKDVAGGEHRTAAEAAKANVRLGQPSVLPAPCYAIFKALYARGSDLTVERESVRLDTGQILASHLQGAAPGLIEFLVPARTYGEKAALAAHQRQQGREGEIWVRHDCQYQGGKDERAQLIVRTKYLKQLAVVVIGLTPSSAATRPFGAIEVGVMDNGVLRSLGQVGTGYTLDEMREIARRFEAGQLTIRVATQGFTERGQLWHGRFVGFADVPPEACTLDCVTDYDDRAEHSEAEMPAATVRPANSVQAAPTLEQTSLF